MVRFQSSVEENVWRHLNLSQQKANSDSVQICNSTNGLWHDCVYMCSKQRVSLSPFVGPWPTQSRETHRTQTRTCRDALSDFVGVRQVLLCRDSCPLDREQDIWKHTTTYWLGIVVCANYFCTPFNRCCYCNVALWPWWGSVPTKATCKIDPK